MITVNDLWNFQLSVPPIFMILFISVSVKHVLCQIITHSPTWQFFEQTVSPTTFPSVRNELARNRFLRILFSYKGNEYVKPLHRKSFWKINFWKLLTKASKNTILIWKIYLQWYKKRWILDFQNSTPFRSIKHPLKHSLFN